GFNFTRATHNIDGMQNLIRKLLREKIAYVADDGIYFSIAEYQKTRKYGQLSDISVGNSRIDNDEYSKENAQDFALWKRQKTDEPAWNFDFSNLNTFEILWSKERQIRGDFSKIMPGRPGWHIECSVMSTRFLGQPFDIHTGGVDLIFPHHENEIAQSTAGDQPKKFANFFVHSEHLLVDGKKMSKSAHNFYTLNDLKKRGFSPLDFRMLVLQSHYKTATNFSWDNLTAAKNRLNNWRNFASLRWQLTTQSPQNTEHTAIQSMLDTAKTKILDNLQTSAALAAIDEIIGRDQAQIAPDEIDRVIDFVDTNLGLNLRESTPNITDDEKEIIKNRELARQQKDWREGDNLRDVLLNDHDIIIKDSLNGTIWSRR
ncbi:MAG: class I tRNA ligase family protein, partial [Candidatus Nanoperiomorbaceae bacterium]